MKYISLAGPSFNDHNCYILPLDSTFPGTILPSRSAVVMEGVFGRIFLQVHEATEFRIGSYYLDIAQQAALFPTANSGLSAMYLGTIGQFKIQLNNDPSVEMKAGTFGLFYLPANQQQQSYFDPGKYELLYIAFSEPYLHSIAHLHEGLQSIHRAVTSGTSKVWYGNFLPMSAKVRQIIREIAETPVKPLTMRARITDLIAEYFLAADHGKASHPSGLKNDVAQKMMQIADYIERNLGEALTVRMLARKSTMNTYTFSQHFKRVFAVSPSEFILQRRIYAAELLLRDTNLSIEEIAYKTGFSDRSHFYKAFKKIHNFSPVKFRVR